MITLVIKTLENNKELNPSSQFGGNFIASIKAIISQYQQFYPYNFFTSIAFTADVACHTSAEFCAKQLGNISGIKSLIQIH